MLRTSLGKRQQALFYLVLDALIVFLVSGLVYRQYGFNGSLVRDDAIYLYSGQQMAKGVPPYVSVYDHKGPLAPMIVGVGAFVARFVDIEDIYVVRATFLLISAGTVVAVYLLASELFESRKVGYLTAFLFLNFWGFGRHAASGPRAKTPMVLFEVLALWLTTRKRWFWAGVSGGLAALVWQPTLIYPAMSTVIAVTQSRNGNRLRHALAVIAGALVPVILVCVYFAWNGALYELLDGAVLFNVLHLDRESVSLESNVRQILRAVEAGYSTAFIPAWLGLGVMPAIFIWRLRQYEGNIVQWLSQDQYCGFLLSVAFPVIFSILDFQWYPDFYILLPYAAIGLGWLLYLSFRGFERTDGATKALETLLFSTLCTILVLLAAWSYGQTASQELALQRAWADEAIARFGPDARLVSIGVPEALVLLHRANPNRYVFVINGIDNHIHATTPGGFDGWIKSLQDYDPHVIFYGSTRGRFASRLDDWLESYYQKSTIGEWTVYARDIDGHTCRVPLGWELYEQAGPFIVDMGWGGSCNDYTKQSSMSR